MKRSICYILIAMAAVAVSCVKDKSTLYLAKVEPIVIDTAGMPASYVVFQFDTLRVAPAIKLEGKDPSSLRYQWTMNAFGGYERVVGNAKQLDARITENPVTTPYALILRVTDTVTNLKAFFSWNINVVSPFGEGLIVADTKDGVNGDVSLVMAFNFTSGFLTDSATSRVFMNAYSKANGNQPVPGLVRQLNYMRYNSMKDITLLTDQSFIRLNPNSYEATVKDKELFVLAPAAIKPDAIQTAITRNQHQYLVNNGKGYGRYGDNKQFGYSFLAPDAAGYETKQICGLQEPAFNLQTGGALYDEKNNRFLMLPKMTSMNNPLVAFRPVDYSDPAPAFDPNAMGDKTCIAMMEGYDQRILSILKDRTSEKYFACQVKLTEPMTGKMGVAMNDISNNPDISSARYFTCSTAEQVLFYATDNKVYATIMEIGSPAVTHLRYTVPAGERITGMKMHTGGGRMYLPDPNAPGDWQQRKTATSANRLLVLSTYNDATKEGKIVAIPLELLGVGGLVTDPAYFRIFGGFGKITAFSLQAL
ncbi:PKD-like family lipoprotein [Chitinophaga sp. NPDC101104]|uniref:PKD-like family lipoprotein n=1 Tax=Chitinophaga sp. NPDC101104 TaxID=3390561 RepID=UPI003D0704C0